MIIGAKYYYLIIISSDIIDTVKIIIPNDIPIKIKAIDIAVIITEN